MKVNKNSWHYKLLARTHVMSKMYADFDSINSRRLRGDSFLQIYEELYSWKDAPNNFCQYWRKAIIKPLLSIMINGTIAAIFTFIVLINITDLLVGSLLLALIFGMLFVFYATIYGVGKLINKITTGVSASEGLIGALIESHKKNICSVIEYEKD